jgi:hypothetical protein
MAGSVDLNVLEHDVEEARARLAGDLARLRDPQTFANAKEELRRRAGEYKEQAASRAREMASSTAQSLLEQARLRVENNPTAALVLTAGLAWKLLRRPPIGGVLVAAGLASLINTRPSQSGSRTPTTDAIVSASAVALERARTASATLQQTSRQIGTQIRETALTASAPAAERAADYAERAAHYASERAQRTGRLAREQYRANPLYFGAAALAAGLALSLATRRRR